MNQTAEISNPEEKPLITVGVISVGDEILEGRVLDAPSQTISEKLLGTAAQVKWHLSVGDAPGELSAALKEKSSQADWIIISGGLGPTEDDRTRQEVSNAFGLNLLEIPHVWDGIKNRMRAHGIEPAENNRRQAFFPEGARILENSRGSAPGFVIEGSSDRKVIALPGVPHEFKGMLADFVLPEVASLKGDVKSGEILDFVAVPESKLDEWIAKRVPADVLYHICVRNWGQIEVRLPVGVSLTQEVKEEFKGHFLGTGGLSIEEHLIQSAIRSKLSLTTAESCTGGMISSRLVNVPGSSRVFPCGWVCYSNPSKTRELDVDPRLMEIHGAVSKEVVEQMAQNARIKAGTDLAVSVSGVAGPDGGTSQKPVGTVWVALATRNSIASHCYQLNGDRTRIRGLTTNLALLALHSMVRKQEIPGWLPNPS
ncbi:MAG: nicotinamide-nucleotide amidohydrolase family protein [Planctomycetia bacterium]|nr:nicotinamide-nucleotide amidohydrolase family protein [Planctomycetia bacterium]